MGSVSFLKACLQLT